MLNPLPTNLPPVLSHYTNNFNIVIDSDVRCCDDTSGIYGHIMTQELTSPDGNVTPLVNSTGPVPAIYNFVNS